MSHPGRAVKRQWVCRRQQAEEKKNARHPRGLSLSYIGRSVREVVAAEERAVVDHLPIVGGGREGSILDSKVEQRNC